MKITQTPKSVDIDITSKCNLRCKYCYHFTGSGDVKKDLPKEEWLKFFEELNECKVMSVTLQGGEPFCRNDLKEMISGIVQNRMRFSILSNGTLITDETAVFLSETHRCNGVQVSIDGSKPEIHDACRGPGSFVKAVEGIRNLQRHGISVQVRVTINRYNAADLEAIAEFILEKLQLPVFSTNAASYMGLCRQHYDQIGLDVHGRMRAMETLLRLNRKYNNRIEADAGPLAEALMWQEMENARNQGIKSLSGRGYLSACGCVFNKMAVRADGIIVPCTMLSHMALGRMNRDSLKDIWQQHPEMQKMRERHKIFLTEFDFCKGCEYIDYCTGNCPGLAYTITGEVHHPSPDACLRGFLKEGGRIPELNRMHLKNMIKKIEEKTYPLNQIYFYLTGGCNLKCRHCWITPKFQANDASYPVLAENIFKSIIEQAIPLGLSGIKLTGGEPLLHTDIGDIFQYIKGKALDLNIETNGLLCTREIARQIGECSNPFVSVSLDGSNEETHEWVRRVPGCFEAALDGIHNLITSGIPTQIIMCIMRRNKDQVGSMVRLAESIGAESVKFNITMPISRGEELHKNKETLTIEELVELGAWIENTLSVSTDLRIVYDHPPAFRALSKMFGQNGNGCSRCGILNILGVLSNGSYALCGIGENVPELVFGHGATDRLEKVWETTGVLNELRTGLTERLEGVCGNCLLKGMCLGSCIAQNFFRTKNLWSPFWYCEQAKKAGLFPEARIKPSIATES